MTPRLKARLLFLRDSLASELEAARKAVSDDGVQELIEIRDEFNEFLKTSRRPLMTDAQMDALDRLNAREMRAMAKAKKYDPIKAVNDAVEAEFLLADFDRYFWGVLREKP